ncbi:MAG: hypothetical protein P8R42_19600 [Candidatus Binatia bacterium]|nr:hypothetical protein [Candidatus Binatia bacterium]
MAWALFQVTANCCRPRPLESQVVTTENETNLLLGRALRKLFEPSVRVSRAGATTSPAGDFEIDGELERQLRALGCVD